MSRLYRQVRRPALILVVLAGLLVGSAAYLLALPLYEVNLSFYNESSELVAQRGITCNGAHWSWGDATLGQPGSMEEEKTACSTSTYPAWFYCWYWMDGNGHVTGGSCISG